MAQLLAALSTQPLCFFLTPKRDGELYGKDSKRERRTAIRLARWERTRAKGKRRFVIRVTLFWIGVMVPVSLLNDYLFEHRFRLFTVIFFAAAGPVVGFVNWWMMEGEYTAAQIDARRKALNK